MLPVFECIEFSGVDYTSNQFTAALGVRRGDLRGMVPRSYYPVSMDDDRKYVICWQE